MKKIAVSIACLMFLICFVGIDQIRAERKAQAERADLMQRKLLDSQELLRGLALEDFEVIAAKAAELNQLSLEAEWTESQSPLYGKYGTEFRNATDRIVDSAEARNLDGAALNYVQLVMACVHCHKAVRGAEDMAFSPELMAPPAGD